MIILIFYNIITYSYQEIKKNITGFPEILNVKIIPAEIANEYKIIIV